MKNIIRIVAACLIVGGSVAASGPAFAFANPALAASTPMAGEAWDSYEIAQADCSGAAAQAAAQTGGEVLSVQAEQRGGQTVCIVTVLVPGQDGGRPRRKTVTIRP